MIFIRSFPESSQRLLGNNPPGTNLQSAATGFKNLGQFVAAVHVSHNLAFHLIN